MTARRILLSITILILCQGCGSMLMKSTPAPVYFQLAYAPLTAACADRFDKGVRIMDLTTASPYDRSSMVAMEEGQKVSYSNTYQWVSPPGALIANKLLRDFSEGALFPMAVDADNPQRPALELTGHVFTFAWEKIESRYQALLYVAVSLVDTAGGQEVILRKNYRLSSRSYQEDTAEMFAEAMSNTVAAFSKELQRDLCEQLK